MRSPTLLCLSMMCACLHMLGGSVLSELVGRRSPLATLWVGPSVSSRCAAIRCHCVQGSHTSRQRGCNSCSAHFARHFRLHSGARGSCLFRRGFIEPAIFSFIAYIVLSKPKTAPGPSEELLARQEELRQEAEATKSVVQKSPGDSPAEQRLTQAIARLKEVEQELQEAESDLQRYPVPPYLKDSCKGGTVNVCVTGASGVGKSSWINAIRKMTARDPGAAKVGIVETTKAPQMFRFPGPAGILRRSLGKVGAALRRSLGRRGEEDGDDGAVPVAFGDRVMLQNCGAQLDGEVAEVVSQQIGRQWKVQLEDGTVLDVKRHQITGTLAECVIWDLPGVGTPAFPQDTYLQRMGIRHFDMVVVMTASRFTEAELMLVQELKRWQVPFFLVRNKVDADVEAEMEAEEDCRSPPAEVEARTVATIKDYFKSEFELDDVYCISSKRTKRDQYDFQKLERDMEVVLRRQRGVTD